MESISSYIIIVFFDAIDFDRLVAAWYQEGHVSARSIARGTADSVVMQRRAREDLRRSSTPIGTLRSSWVYMYVCNVCI